jgi:signal transduction histidine kinase
LASHDVQEWEISDHFLDRILRYHLVKSPGGRHRLEERRSARAILTVKDITDFREVHRTLVRQKDDLVRRLSERDVRLNESHERLLQECEVHDIARDMLNESRQKLRLLARELSNAQESERRRIALDLHDGIAQRLGAIKYHVEIVGQQIADKGCKQEFEMLQAVVGQIRDTTEELRRISSNLSPVQLEDSGIEAALKLLCKDFESQCSHIELRHEISLCGGSVPELIGVAIYRVAQEAMQNIAKHANSSSVKVCLGRSDHGIVLKITDDGLGIGTRESREETHKWSGSGLGNMRERVEASAGTFEIRSELGEGTCVLAHWSDNELALLGSDEAVGDRVSCDGRDIV